MCEEKLPRTFGKGMLDRAERKTKKRIKYAGITCDGK